MNWFNRISIKYKLLFIPLVGVLGFGTNLAYNFSVNTETSVSLESVRDQYYPILEKANNMIVLLDRTTEKLNSAVSAGELDIINTADENADKLRELEADIYELEPLRKDEVEQLRSQFDKYYSAARALSEGMITGSIDFSQLNQKVEEMGKLQSKLKSNLQNFRDESHRLFTSNISDSIEKAQEALTVGAVIALVITVDLPCRKLHPLDLNRR